MGMSRAVRPRGGVSRRGCLPSLQTLVPFTNAAPGCCQKDRECPPSPEAGDLTNLLRRSQTAQEKDLVLGFPGEKRASYQTWLDTHKELLDLLSTWKDSQGAPPSRKGRTKSYRSVGGEGAK